MTQLSARERLSAVRAAVAAVPARVSSHPAVTGPRTWAAGHRWTVRALGVSVATAAMTAAAPTMLPTYPTHEALAAGAITGAVLSVGLIAQRALAPRLGKLTSIASLAAASSLVLTLLALALPHCPGGLAPPGQLPGRCGPADVGAWMTVGIVIPVTATILLAGPLLLARLARKAARLLARVVLGRRTAGPRRASMWAPRSTARQSPAGPSTDQRDQARARRRRARAARRRNRRA